VAANKTREAAQANTRAAKTTVKQSRNVAERAALTYVGATLEARDRVLGVVNGVTDVLDKYSSFTSAEKELTKFERRGNKARNEIERRTRRTRTRVERLVRRNRVAIQRDAERRPNVVTERIDFVSSRVEDAVQTGVATGERVVAKAREQVKTLA